MDFEENSELVEKAKMAIPAVVVVIILAAAVFYYYNLPQPTTLEITASLKDYGTPAKGVSVTVNDANENVLGVGVTELDGTLALHNIPGRQTVYIGTDGDGRYSALHTTAETESGGSTTAALEMTTAADATISILGSIDYVSESCVKPVEFKIANNMETDIQAEIVVTSSNPGLNIKQPDPTSVPPKMESTLSSSISVLPGVLKNGDNGQPQSTTATLTARIKGTAITASRDISITPASVLTVDGSLSATELTTTTLVLKNGGSTPINGLNKRFQVSESETVSACGSDASGCIFLDWPNNADGTAVDTILPGQSLTVPAKIMPPAKTSVTKKYLGALIINATCLGTPGISVPFDITTNPIGA